MQGLVLAHLLVLAAFCAHAATSLATGRAPRDIVPTDASIRFSTYNLRFDSMPDNITVPQSIAALPDPLAAPAAGFLGISGEQPWSTRRIKVAQRLLSEGVIMASECAPCGDCMLSRLTKGT